MTRLVNLQLGNNSQQRHKFHQPLSVTDLVNTAFRTHLGLTGSPLALSALHVSGNPRKNMYTPLKYYLLPWDIA